MIEGGGGSVWRARLRWRAAGATQWPLFAILTVADAILLTRLPLAGERTDLAGGLLLATFFNLVAVAGLGRMVARALRHRRPDLPRVVAEDRAGSALLVVVAIGLLAGGLAHRPGRLAERRAFRAQSEAVRSYVERNAPGGYRARVADADTWRQGPDLYRTCVPGDPAAHDPPLCLIVSTDRSPPGIAVDPDRTPNSRLIGPGGTSRRRG